MVGRVSALGLGMYGGAHLRAPVGATGLSIGGAQTASPKYLCSWWNPAAIVNVRQKKLTFGTGYRPMGRAEGYLGFDFLVPPRVGVELSVLYRGMPKIEGLVDDQEYPLDDCAYETFSFKIGLSYLLRKNLTAGFNISIFYQSLPTDFDSRNGNITYSSVTEIGGIDIGVCYLPTKRLTLGFVIKNILADFNWEIKDKDNEMSAVYDDKLPMTVTIAQEFKTSLLNKPFIWSSDVIGYFINSGFTTLDRNHVVINNGFEWQRWEMFYIRAGIRDITLNSDIVRNSSRYKDHFSLAVTGGFLLDLSKALKGKDIKLNYGISTDKVWAGLDQQIDFVFSF